MRILRISGGNLYGGIETLLKTYALHQDLCPEFEQEFAFSFNSRIFHEIERTASRAYCLGNVRTRLLHRVWLARRRLGRLLDERAYDAVVCHAAWPHAVFAPVIRRRRVPLAFFLHDLANGRHWVERLARRTRPDLILCNSVFTSLSAAKLWNDVPVEVTYHPVPDQHLPLTAEERANVRQRAATAADAVVIVQVARMEPYKGHLHNFKALARLKHLPQWVLWVVGGAQRPREQRYLELLKDQARELGIGERVRFLGERRDVGSLLSASDIFSHPNDAPEPFGISFIEALYAGIPAISFAIGGAREIVTDQCGILVPPGDAEGLSEALRRLMENPGLRAELGSGGAARAVALCNPHIRIRSEFEALRKLAHSGSA